MKWSEKQLQERAEVLFQRVCDERGYQAVKVPVKKKKTPDFSVRAGSIEFVAEIKCPGLDPQLKQAMGKSPVTLWSKPGKRVRKLLKDSSAQLAAAAATMPRILVICDLRPFLSGYPMYPWYQFGSGDLSDGMFGETQFVFENRGSGLVPLGPQLGGNRTLRNDCYTHISAVGLLYWQDIERPSGIHVYHNPFADQKFPTDCFNGNGDRNFRLMEKNGELINLWENCHAPRKHNV